MKIEDVKLTCVNAEVIKKIQEYFVDAKNQSKCKKVWDELQAKAMLEECILSEKDIVLGAYSHNEMIGMVLLKAIRAYMESNFEAVDVVWHSDPNLGKIKCIKILLNLLAAAEKKAVEKKISTITIGVPPHSPLIRALKDRGFQESNLILKKELNTYGV